MKEAKETVEKESVKSESVTIKPLNLRIARFEIGGNAWLVMNKFTKKAMDMMEDKMKRGSLSKKEKPAREPRVPKRDYEQATHKFKDGTPGIPATAIRAALIRACSLCDFKMTIGKLALTPLADGYDPECGTPLIKFTSGKREMIRSAVINQTGVADLRYRPKWDEGWTANLRIQFDANIFTTTDIANLLQRAGLQCGICAGRPSSKNSVGMGWGTFEIKNKKES